MSCSSLELPAGEAMLLAKERQAQQSGSGSTLHVTARNAIRSKSIMALTKMFSEWTLNCPGDEYQIVLKKKNPLMV